MITPELLEQLTQRVHPWDRVTGNEVLLGVSVSILATLPLETDDIDLNPQVTGTEFPQSATLRHSGPSAQPYLSLRLTTRDEDAGPLATEPQRPIRHGIAAVLFLSYSPPNQPRHGEFNDWIDALCLHLKNDAQLTINGRATVHQMTRPVVTNRDIGTANTEGTPFNYHWASLAWQVECVARINRINRIRAAEMAL